MPAKIFTTTFDDDTEHRHGPRGEAEPGDANGSTPVTRVGAKSPGLFKPDELRTRLRAYDRTPFLDVLALFLECTPSEDAIRAFAERSPDKFVAALSQLGGIAGFTQRTEINNNVNVSVSRMSDSQIEDQLNQIMAKLEPAAPPQIEHEPLGSPHEVRINRGAATDVDPDG